MTSLKTLFHVCNPSFRCHRACIAIFRARQHSSQAALKWPDDTAFICTLIQLVLNRNYREVLVLHRNSCDGSCWCDCKLMSTSPNETKREASTQPASQQDFFFWIAWGNQNWLSHAATSKRFKSGQSNKILLPWDDEHTTLKRNLLSIFPVFVAAA